MLGCVQKLVNVFVAGLPRLDFRRLPGPVFGGWVRAHFPEQRLVIEPKVYPYGRKCSKNNVRSLSVWIDRLGYLWSCPNGKRCRQEPWLSLPVTHCSKLNRKLWRNDPNRRDNLCLVRNVSGGNAWLPSQLHAINRLQCHGSLYIGHISWWNIC